MPRICVIGSANVDLTVKTSRLPRPGETVSGGELLIAHGGKGANQAVAARRLGAEVRFTACLGIDAFGDQVARQLAAAGLPQDRLVRVSEARTGVASIIPIGAKCANAAPSSVLAFARTAAASGTAPKPTKRFGNISWRKRMR